MYSGQETNHSSLVSTTN